MMAITAMSSTSVKPCSERMLTPSISRKASYPCQVMPLYRRRRPRCEFSSGEVAEADVTSISKT